MSLNSDFQVLCSQRPPALKTQLSSGCCAGKTFWNLPGSWSPPEHFRRGSRRHIHGMHLPIGNAPIVNPAAQVTPRAPVSQLPVASFRRDQPQGDRTDVGPGKTPRASIRRAQVSFLSSLHVSAGTRVLVLINNGSSDTVI